MKTVKASDGKAYDVIVRPGITSCKGCAFRDPHYGGCDGKPRTGLPPCDSMTSATSGFTIFVEHKPTIEIESVL